MSGAPMVVRQDPDVASGVVTTARCQSIDRRESWWQPMARKQDLVTKLGENVFVFWQVLSACGCGLVHAGMMTSLSFPAVALPEMSLASSPVTLTPSAQSWFANLPLLMYIPGSLMGGMVCERVGPRRLQLMLAPVLALSMALMSLATWPSLLHVAPTLLLTCRVVQGIAAALMLSLMSVYPCEVSDEARRGTLTSLSDAWASVGLLLPYLLGRYMPWHTLSWFLPLITLIPAVITLLLAPESPLWLVRKGREEEARQAFSKLRRSLDEAEEESQMARNSKEITTTSCSKTLRLIGQPAHLKPIVISALILVMKQLSGSSALIVYIIRIFQQTGVGLDPHWSSVLVGIARLACNLFGSALILRLPRKKLLASGIAITSLATSSMATFFYLQYRGNDVSWLGWLPVMSLVLFMLGYSVGTSPAAWLVSVELLPDAVRSIGFGVGLTCYSTSSFIVAKTFDDVVAAWGMHGVFWCYSAGCSAYALLVVFFVPETKGKSRKEIEDIWYKNGTLSNTDDEACV